MRRVVAAALVLAAAACIAPGGTLVPPAGTRYETCDRPEFATAFGHAISLLDQRQLMEALGALRAAIEACPDHVPAHERYQDTALAVGGDAAAAMRAWYAALPDRADSPVPPYCRARLGEDEYSRLGLLDEALRRDPSFYFAYLSRARVQRELGRLDAARADLEKAVAARPTHPESNLELAGVLMDIGRYEEAEPYLSNYVGARPADRGAAKVLAQLLLYRLGRTDAAARLLERLHAEEREDAAVRMDLAAVAWRRREYPAAIAGYHEVLTLDSSRTRAALNLGNLYLELAHRERGEVRDAYLRKARKAYRFFVEADRAEGMHDALDATFTVPYRIDEIGKELGADDAEPPLPGRNF